MNEPCRWEEDASGNFYSFCGCSIPWNALNFMYCPFCGHRILWEEATFTARVTAMLEDYEKNKKHLEYMKSIHPTHY